MRKRMRKQTNGQKVFHATIKTVNPKYNNELDRVHTISDVNRYFKADFSSLAEQQAEITRIQRSDYAKKHWPGFAAAPTIKVYEAKPWETPYEQTRWVFDRPVRAELYFGNNSTGRARLTMLHELAHAVEDLTNGERAPFYFDDDDIDNQGHGPAFAKRNIEMVRQFYSKEMGDKLEANFRAGGVEIAP